MGKYYSSSLCYISAITALGLVAVLCPAAVFAQADDEFAEAEVVEEIVVTGSRIKKRNLFSTSPVTHRAGCRFSHRSNSHRSGWQPSNSIQGCRRASTFSAHS